MVYDKKNIRGFTIVELLIVVVVIAILAAITIVSYNGISNRAKETSLASELATAAKKIESKKIQGGTDAYPSTFAQTDVVVPGGVNSSYRQIGNAYCLGYVRDGLSMYISNTTGRAEKGVCSALGGVSTFAGSGTPGVADGTGTGAQLSSMFGIAKGPNGDLYTASGTTSVRKITQAGVVTTITSSPATVITAIHVGADNMIYFTSANASHRVGKMTQSGAVTLLGGAAGTVGSADGNASVASFNSPYGITTDSDGVVYVADTWNHRIRKIALDGTVSTLAGSSLGNTDGQGTAAQFNRPYGITVDADKNLYVSDTNNLTVRKVTPSGYVSTYASIRVGGLEFANDGNLYAVAYPTHTIVKINSAGAITTVAGSGSAGYADGVSAAAQFNGPNDITIMDNGTMFVADLNNYRVRKIE